MEVRQIPNSRTECVKQKELKELWARTWWNICCQLAGVGHQFWRAVCVGGTKSGVKIGSSVASPRYIGVITLLKPCPLVVIILYSVQCLLICGFTGNCKVLVLRGHTTIWKSLFNFKRYTSLWFVVLCLFIII